MANNNSCTFQYYVLLLSTCFFSKDGEFLDFYWKNSDCRTHSFPWTDLKWFPIRRFKDQDLNYLLGGIFLGIANTFFILVNTLFSRFLNDSLSLFCIFLTGNGIAFILTLLDQGDGQVKTNFSLSVALPDEWNYPKIFIYFIYFL